MKLFYYSKNKNHTSADTDRMILESLEHCCGKPQSAFGLERSENGKPYIKGNEVFVGATHTDELVIIAVDDENFGIDCENMARTVTRAESIAKKYYSDKEREYVFEKDTGKVERNLRFLEIWVKKEAYVKYLGTGVKDIKNCDTFLVKGSFEKVIYGDNIIYIYRPE